MPNEDPWATSTGLLDNIEGVIESAHFGTDARYNNGETTLLFLGVKPDEELPENFLNDDGLFEVSLPVGGGWHSYDGGETIEHTEGKTKIHANSVYGKVVDWALENDLGPVLREKGSPLEAKVWIGLHLAFGQQTIKYGGEIGDKKRMMPTGVLDGTEAGTEGSDASKDDLEGYGDELKALAENSPDAESFTEAAMGLTDITDHSSLVMQIADGSLFDKLKG